MLEDIEYIESYFPWMSFFVYDVYKNMKIFQFSLFTLESNFQARKTMKTAWVTNDVHNKFFTL